MTGSMRLYKLTDPDGRPVHGGNGRWPLPTDERPGRWRSVRGPLQPCVSGLHLMRLADLPDWLRAGTLWEAEAAEGEQIDDGDKIVVRRARLVRRAADVTQATVLSLAADFAERALPIFEAQYPDDDRPREAIEAVRAFVRGDITRARLAYVSAARAADAYSVTRAVAAVNAAYAASAAYAARAAADAASAARAVAAANAAHAASAAAADAADAAYVASTARAAAAADAAHTAYVSAARAADAASAAHAAAAANADAVARAAAVARRLAADRQAEREWQAAHIAEVLGLAG